MTPYRPPESPVACSVEALRSLLQLKKGLTFCNLLQVIYLLLDLNNLKIFFCP